MAQNIPPPGGGPPPAGYGAPAPYDPYAADRALAEWAQARGYALNPNPDASWYKGWHPCVYMPAIARVGRELRASFGEAGVAIVEVFGGDPLLQATGDDRRLALFVLSPRLVARAAIRSKQGGGIVNELSSGLSSLFGSGASPGSILGDPTFEGRYEVTIPSRDEGHRALPMGLRQLLLAVGFRGILEVRPGGLLGVNYDRQSFDPATLDAVITLLGQIYHAAAAG